MLTVNNKPVKFRTEARAFLDRREVTAILKRQNIDIRTFGHFDWQKDIAPEFSRLAKSEQDKLIKLGLFDPDEPWGNWTVRLQYHWTQTFPSHSTVHIHHEYTPVRGFAMLPIGAIHKALHQRRPIDPSLKGSEWDMKLLNSFCPSVPFLRSLEKSMKSERNDDDYAHSQWVDFVLTTANTWKQPIEDFTLVVERDALYPKDPDRTLVAFCSPGHKYVERLSDQQLRVHVADFVPKSELRIGFFDVPRQEHVARRANSR